MIGGVMRMQSLRNQQNLRGILARVLAADVNITGTTTCAEITGLQSYVEAGKTYQVNGIIRLSVNAAGTAPFNYRPIHGSGLSMTDSMIYATYLGHSEARFVAVSSGGTTNQQYSALLGASSATLAIVGAQSAPVFGNGLSNSLASGTAITMLVTGIMVASGSGTWSVGFAPASSGNTVTVAKGSSLNLIEI